MTTAPQPPLQWTCENSHLHSARCGHTATAIPQQRTDGDVVAIAFGDSNKQHYASRTYFGSAILYDAATATQLEVVQAPLDVVPGRSHHCAAALGKNVIFVGGRGPNGDYFDSGPSSCCTLLQLDTPRKWKVLRCPAEGLARRGHTLHPLHGQYLVFGGERRGMHLDDLWTFHPKKLQWEKEHVSSGPAPRAFHAAATVEVEGGDYLGVFGGQTADSAPPFDIHTLDRRSGEWQHYSLVKGETADSLPAFPGHFGHTVAAMGGNRFLLYGGWSTEDGSVDYRAMLIVVDPRTQRFTVRPAPIQGSAPEPRAYHATTTTGAGAMVVFGGWKMNTLKASASVWCLDRVEKPKRAKDDARPLHLDLPGLAGAQRPRRGSWAVDATVRVVHQSPDRVVQVVGDRSSGTPSYAGSAESRDAPDAAFQKLPVRMLSCRMLDLSVVESTLGLSQGPRVPCEDVPEAADVVKAMLIDASPPWKEPPKGSPFKLLSLEALRRLIAKGEQVMLNEDTVVEIPPPARVYGDFHGQITEMIGLFRAYGSPDDVTGDVNLVNYVFLGDYVDRGDYSLEVITLLLSLKVRYPANVHLLRGNHEDRHINISYGFEKECVTRLGRRDGKEIWEAFNRVFDAMPIGALIGHRILCVHGGLGKELKSVDQLGELERPIANPQENSLLRDVLWSDPTSNDSVVGLHANARGEGIWEFGPDKVDEFCRYNDVDLIIRAHQCVISGYEYFARGHVITIFSAAGYCGHNNAGAMLEISPALRVHAKTIQPCPSPQAKR